LVKWNKSLLQTYALERIGGYYYFLNSGGVDTKTPSSWNEESGQKFFDLIVMGFPKD
jgi:hypothetical protein